MLGGLNKQQDSTPLPLDSCLTATACHPLNNAHTSYEISLLLVARFFFSVLSFMVTLAGGGAGGAMFSAMPLAPPSPGAMGLLMVLQDGAG